MLVVDGEAQDVAFKCAVSKPYCLFDVMSHAFVESIILLTRV